MEIELAQSFDIDKIDGLGAVGVARLFVMSGKYANSIYYNLIGSTSGFTAPNMEFKRRYFNILDKLHLVNISLHILRYSIFVV